MAAVYLNEFGHYVSMPEGFQILSMSQFKCRSQQSWIFFFLNFLPSCVLSQVKSKLHSHFHEAIGLYWYHNTQIA